MIKLYFLSGPLVERVMRYISEVRNRYVMQNLPSDPTSSWPTRKRVTGGRSGLHSSHQMAVRFVEELR